MSPRWGEDHLVGPEAINISLLRSEDAPRRSRIVVEKENKKLLICYTEKNSYPFYPCSSVANSRLLLHNFEVHPLHYARLIFRVVVCYEYLQRVGAGLES
jgi:hypothetical protein